MSADAEKSWWLTEDLVRGMVGTALTRSDLRGLDIDETQVEKHVLAQMPRLSAALRGETAAVVNAHVLVEAVTESVSQPRRELVIAGQVTVNVLLGGWLLLLIQSWLEIDWPWHHIRWPFFPTVASTINALLIGLIVTMLLIGTNLALRDLKNVLARRLEELPSYLAVENALKTLSDKAQAEVEALVREAVNALDAPGSTAGSLLTKSEAPALIELDTADTVSATGLRQVEDFIDRHPNSAIGVAGPRGVGKSTVLRRISASAVDSGPGKRRVGVYIQSPVYYQAADFVRTVHEEIARAILRDAHRQYEPPELRIERRVRALRGMTAAVLLGIGILLTGLDIWEVAVPQFSAMGLLGVTFVGIFMCYVLFGRAVSRSSRRVARFATDEVDLAQREIRKLTWSANVASKEKTTLKLLPGLNSDTEQQMSYAERDRSHPDRVADLRNFLRDFYRVSEVPVVVAIDELDKMAAPEHAIEAINGLKDLFHLQNTHFVVSVSEDALASFALRGVPVRDVFDSAFDDVVRMRPFSAENSVNLLLGRTVKFPRVASLFCHAISGGLPRDLIRAARRMVDVRRHADGDVAVTKAFQIIVRNDLVEAVDAAARKARENGDAAEEVHLFRLATALADQPNFGMGALESRPDLLTSVTPEFASFVLTMITIREFFEDLLNQGNWRQLIKAHDTVTQIDELAAARSLVAVSQLDCTDRLIQLRAQTGLVAIPKSVAHRAAPTLVSYNGHPARSKMHATLVASLAAVKIAVRRSRSPRRRARIPADDTE